MINEFNMQIIYSLIHEKGAGMLDLVQLQNINYHRITVMHYYIMIVNWETLIIVNVQKLLYKNVQN